MLFIKRNDKDVAIFLVYIDDMIVIGNDYEEMDRTKKTFVVEFELI